MPNRIPQNFSWRASNPVSSPNDISNDIIGCVGNELMDGVIESIVSLCNGNMYEDVNTQVVNIENNIRLYKTKYATVCNDITFTKRLMESLNREYENWIMCCTQYGINPNDKYIHTDFVTKFNPLFINELMNNNGMMMIYE